MRKNTRLKQPYVPWSPTFCFMIYGLLGSPFGIQTRHQVNNLQSSMCSSPCLQPSTNQKRQANCSWASPWLPLLSGGAPAPWSSLASLLVISSWGRPHLPRALHRRHETLWYSLYMERQLGKPVLLTGPVLSEPSPMALEERWAQWLGGFKPGSVIFCAFGSQNFPEKDQFQELLLGFEQTGLPFLAALKPPLGAATIEEALPEGFQERVGGRGLVHEVWVPQPSILSHLSVGCFVSHCGFGLLRY